MMTVAALQSALLSPRGVRERDCGLGVVDTDHGERFLRDLGVILYSNSSNRNSSSSTTSMPASIKSSSVHLNCPPYVPENKRDSDSHSDQRKKRNEKGAATRIQAQIRRYFGQRRYRIQMLERRLLEVDQSKHSELERIDRRKQRKLHKASQKYDRREQRLEEECQKVTGIVHYLQRDQKQCQKELENYGKMCRELKSDNQRLRVARDRTLSATKHTQQAMDELQHTNRRLQTTLQVYREAIQQVKACLQEQQATLQVYREASLQLKGCFPEQENNSSTITTSPQNHQKRQHRRRHSHPPKKTSTQAYESAIHVRCNNEVEESCFHYRLVQDVYTLPRGGSVSRKKG